MGALTLQVLFDINLTVQHNEFVAIMGPSGSGKSTLMNILGGLDQPTSGDYLFDGQNISGLDDGALSRIRNQRIGFVFQNFSLLPRMTARENVEVPLVYAGMSPKERRSQAEKMLEMSESSGLHPKPHLRNPAARRTVRRHTGSLSDCGLPIHGRRSRQETGISSTICTWMISLWR